MKVALTNHSIIHYSRKKIYEIFTWTFKHSFEKLVENQDWSVDERYIAAHVTIYNGVVGNVNILRE